MYYSGRPLTLILPLYAFVLAGFFAGRRLGVRKESIAPLLIYIFAPLVILKGTLTVALDAPRLLLPPIVYVLCCLMCVIAYRIAPFPSPARNILGFTAGNCNSGYFGIPAAVALLGEQAFAQATMLSFSFVLCENTVGFYVSARGHATPAQALRRVARLPTAYAFLLGIALRVAGLQLPPSIDATFTLVRGAYTVLGMMLLGLALADLARFTVDWRFTGFALAVKFIAWPLAAGALIVVDKQHFHVLDVLAQKGLMIAATLPLAANTVAIATLNKAEPEKASVAVLVSTLVALLIIPALGGLL